MLFNIDIQAAQLFFSIEYELVILRNQKSDGNLVNFTQRPKKSNYPTIYPDCQAYTHYGKMIIKIDLKHYIVPQEPCQGY